MIKNVIFDVDDVLMDQDHSYLEFFKTQPGYGDITYDDFFERFPAECFASGSFSLALLGEDVRKAYLSSPFFRDRPPYDGAMETLEDLRSRGIRTFAQTAAFPEFIDEKKSWLFSVFGERLDEIYVNPEGEPKLGFLRAIVSEHGLDPSETTFVDDRFKNIKDGLSCGFRVLHMLPRLGIPLPDDLRALGVKTVKNLPEAKEYILADF
ncbi:MAG: HAD family hydrolase [Rickettsiales bacterium]|jgi:HAD superfamily hydrolase (TIGR01509 family)|nr:HAD family hydrolase [Rickettsiales bacterium]